MPEIPDDRILVLNAAMRVRYHENRIYELGITLEVFNPVVAEWVEIEIEGGETVTKLADLLQIVATTPK